MLILLVEFKSRYQEQEPYPGSIILLFRPRSGCVRSGYLPNFTPLSIQGEGTSQERYSF